MYSLKSPVNEYNNILEEYLLNMNQDNLGKLYEIVRTPIYNFALSIVKNRSLAEDILHEVIISIYENANNYQTKNKPMAWILIITKNNALMKLRKDKKIVDLKDEDWLKIKKEENITKDELILLKFVLEKLSDEERQIITLNAISGLKYREIANVLNLPLPTVLSKSNRALKKIKNMLKEESYEK